MRKSIFMTHTVSNTYCRVGRRFSGHYERQTTKTDHSKHRHYKLMFYVSAINLKKTVETTTFIYMMQMYKHYTSLLQHQITG